MLKTAVSLALDSGLDHAPDTVVAPITQPVIVTLKPFDKSKAQPVTMAELKAGLPDYFAPIALIDAVFDARTKGAKWNSTARALVRLMLISAHSGTVSNDAKTIASQNKGVFASRMTACHDVISAAKASLKGCASLSDFEVVALDSELGFLEILQPIAKTSDKPVKSASEKIITLIQGATLNDEDIKTIRAALSNAAKKPAIETAPL